MRGGRDGLREDGVDITGTYCDERHDAVRILLLLNSSMLGFLVACWFDVDVKRGGLVILHWALRSIQENNNNMMGEPDH